MPWESLVQVEHLRRLRLEEDYEDLHLWERVDECLHHLARDAGSS